MAMTPDERHAKPHQDAKAAPERREGPAKGDKKAPAVLARTHLAAKPPVEAGAAREGVAPSTPAGDPQQPPSHEPPDQARSRPMPGTGEQYVRLTVRVDNGELSIVDSHLVDGPLAQVTAFQGGFAYEVVDGSRLLHAGSIPDLGMVRGFAHPNGTLEQQRHHTYELSSYEFDARVPVTSLRAADMSNVSIALYRVKQPETATAAHGVLSTESLAVQRERSLREIGRVTGVPASVLEPEASFVSRRAPEARSQARKVRDEGGERDSEDEEDRGD